MDARISKIHFASAFFILGAEILNFCYKCIVERDFIGVGDFLLFTTVVVLFFASKTLLLRFFAWGMILFGMLLPFGIFPIFGDEYDSVLTRISLSERIALFCLIEMAFLLLAWLLLKLVNLSSSDVHKER